MFNSIKKKIAAETGRDPSDLLPHLLEKLSPRTSSISSLTSIATSETDRNECLVRSAFVSDPCDIESLRERVEKLETDKRRLLDDQQNASVIENCLREEIGKLKDLLLVQDQQLEMYRNEIEKNSQTTISIDTIAVSVDSCNEQKKHLLAFRESLVKLKSEVTDTLEKHKEQLASTRIDIDNRIHTTYDQFENLIRLKNAKLDRKKQKIKDLRKTMAATNFNKPSSSSVAIVAPTTSASSLSAAIATDCDVQSEQQVKESEQTSPQNEFDSDINTEYLRNILLRFLTSPIDQCRYLVPAVSAALNFSIEEQDLLREHFEKKTSGGTRWWFR